MKAKFLWALLLSLTLLLPDAEAGRRAAAPDEDQVVNEATPADAPAEKKSRKSRKNKADEEEAAEYQTVAFRVGLWRVFTRGMAAKLEREIPDPELLRSNAEKGDVNAQLRMGLGTLSGSLGFTQNLKEGAGWLRRCADQNEPWCQTALGIHHLIGRGNGVDLDDEKGAALIRKAAESGLPIAQFIYANMAWKGLPGGVPNEAEALRWFKTAAEQGDVFSQNQMAKLYFFGNLVPQSKEEAIRWAKKAAEQGDGDSELLLGVIYLNSAKPLGDPEQAALWLKKAVSHGEGDAAYHLARLYFYGIGGATRDPVTAAQWARQGAEQGFSAAQGLLGRMYFVGMGVERDVKASIHWLVRAAEQGDALAMHTLSATPPRGGELEPEAIYQWVLLCMKHPELSNYDGMESHLKKIKKELDGVLTKEEKAEGRRRAKEWRARQESPPQE
ncbi:MAG: sel1 repeat family protein [Magnetococcales bacterium]|nr:sel1 repeat family protein [Magnetococcales bacterium]